MGEGQAWNRRQRSTFEQTDCFCRYSLGDALGVGRLKRSMYIFDSISEETVTVLKLFCFLKFRIVVLILVHAAVIAINEAIEKGIAEQTIATLRNPNAMLLNVDEELAQDYQNELFDAKRRKQSNARLKVVVYSWYTCSFMLLPIL